jgi:TonB family protein
LRRTTFPPDYPKKPVEIKSASPIAERPVTQMKQVEQPKEKANQSVTQIADVKPIENKKVVQSAETEKTNHKSEDAQKLNSLFRTKDKKIVESLNEKNSAVNKPSLKIRETKFVEDEVKQNQALKVNPKVEDIKSVVENLLKDKHLTGTLTVDEVLSKLNQENLKPQPEPIDNELAFEQEIQNINKKRKIGILVSTVLFVAVAVTAIFVYLKLQPDTLQAASEIKLNKQQVVTNPQVDNVTSNESNLAVNETIPTTEPAQIEDKQDELTKTEEEKPTTENQIKITPINNNLGKQDESYTQLNENNSSNTQLNNQTAAAKTETTTPPKENKPKEEEPSVFVAVEEMPQLVGGLKQLQTKIKYPEIAKRTGIEGKVYVTAIVDENGNVISASTTKGIGAGCDEAAIDAVRNSKFTPGKQRGKNVKVQVTIPIMFKKY